jgi:regulator of ribosome biosynthesis
VAKQERKDRVAKNSRQHARNLADAAAAIPAPALERKPLGLDASQSEKKTARTVRKAELERGMLVSKTATASLGRFDRKIEGEPKAKGIKRKFDANVGDHAVEKAAAMELLGKIGTAEGKKAPKKGSAGKDGDLNLRKAVRLETRTKQLENRRGKK